MGPLGLCFDETIRPEGFPILLSACLKLSNESGVFVTRQALVHHLDQPQWPPNSGEIRKIRSGCGSLSPPRITVTVCAPSTPGVWLL